MIEAPMSGAPMKAKGATLTFMVGASSNDFENILPILNILEKKYIILVSLVLECL